MSAHTPGPWRISSNEERVYGDLETVVVYELNTNEADHRLIAAAPELLEALKDARARLRAIVGPSYDIDPSAEAMRLDATLAKVQP